MRRCDVRSRGSRGQKLLISSILTPKRLIRYNAAGFGGTWEWSSNLPTSGTTRAAPNEPEREKKMSKSLIGVSTLVFSLALAQSAMAQDTNQQASKVAGELGAIANILQSHPEMVLDFTNVSGEYCMNTWKAGGAHICLTSPSTRPRTRKTSSTS